jgi:uncharacterized protein (TIGR03083 family)
VQLGPVYGDRPLLVVDLPPTGAVHPVVAQRRRFQASLADLDEADWRRPSRCEGWTVQDVIIHLVGVNQFWALSVGAGLAGEPTRYLATFDPVETPAQMVAAAAGQAPAETLAAFVDSNEAFLALVEGLADDELELFAEAPPGHVPIRRLADHAVWDSWVHERDVFLPLGRTPVEERDEVLAGLRYDSALAPGLGIMYGLAPAGDTSIEATDLGERFVVSVGDDQVRVHAGPPADGAPVVEGAGVELLELLSVRDTGNPAPPGVATIMEGLARVFGQSGTDPQPV